MVQHKAVRGPNEVAHQGRCRHAVTACDYAGLCPDGGRVPWCDAA